MKIGIAGLGTVGYTINRYFTASRYIPEKYDPPLGWLGDLNRADVIFVCVPTPSQAGAGFDLSYIHSVLSRLDKGKVAVIKSTVLPFTCQNLSDDYSHLRILSNPEFLTESKAESDFNNPVVQLVGYTKDSDIDVAREVLDMLPKGSVLHEVCKAEVCEAIKISRNVLSAAKIVALNDLYTKLEFFGIDYDDVKKGLYALETLNSHHLEVVHKGGRGAGGKCLRKDLNAYTEWKPSVLGDMIFYENERLLKNYPKED
jgi:UDPglucose 6-dehydrogenase